MHSRNGVQVKWHGKRILILYNSDIVKEENRASLSALEKKRESLQVEELKKQAEKLTKQLEELEGTLATLYHEE